MGHWAQIECAPFPGRFPGGSPLIALLSKAIVRRRMFLTALSFLNRSRNFIEFIQRVGKAQSVYHQSRVSRLVTFAPSNPDKDNENLRSPGAETAPTT